MSIDAEKLEQTADRVEQRAKLLRLLGRRLREDPGLADDLARCAAQSAGGASLFDEVSSNGQESIFERIQTAMERRAKRTGTPWVTIAQIAGATGLTETAVRDAIYKRHKDQFRKKADPSHGRRKLWALKGGTPDAAAS